MKKIIFTTILASYGFLFSQCKKALKDVNDYYPVVRTVSVTEMPDGSVQVIGEIEQEGEAPIDYAGICVSTDPVPEMTDAQVICQLNGNQFSAFYTKFDPYEPYYFRSWATNDYGYSYGNILTLDSIEAVPVNAPCEPALNTIDIGTVEGVDNLTASAPEPGFNQWTINCSGYSILSTIKFSFGDMPHTSVYTTTTSTNPGTSEVYASFYAGFISGTLSSGSKVYVHQLSPSSWEITICDAAWVYNNFTYHLTTCFMSPH